MAVRMSTLPCFSSSRYLLLLPGRVKKPGQYWVCDGVITPYFCAASAYSGLTVDPGGYAPLNARFNNGTSILFDSAASPATDKPRTKPLGSNPGVLASTMMSPVLGSSATTDPR